MDLETTRGLLHGSLDRGRRGHRSLREGMARPSVTTLLENTDTSLVALHYSLV